MRRTMTLCSVLAVLALAAPAAMAEGSMNQPSKFCLSGPGAAKDCKYDTLAACDQAKKVGQSCAANTSTTGTAAPGSSPPSSAPNDMKK